MIIPNNHSLTYNQGTTGCLDFTFNRKSIVIPALSRIEIRAKKEYNETKLNLSIYNNGRLKKVSVMEAELQID
jgi:hypothetical protein